MKPKQIKYRNRYNEIFTFTQTSKTEILWEGNFEYCRYGLNNCYDKAYKKYLEDGNENIPLNKFIQKIHISDEKGLMEPYINLIYPLIDVIYMVDPSGGPYINKGMDMKYFDLKGIVDGFERTETGYKIIVK